VPRIDVDDPTSNPEAVVDADLDTLLSHAGRHAGHALE